MDTLKINLHPTECNLCGGKVVFVSNAGIYGKEYGSGYCYWCTNCGAYVGTHKKWITKAFGILANAEMRKLKRACHTLFDGVWSNPKERKLCYEILAEQMGIPVEECHFGYFDTDKLKQAYTILHRRELQNEFYRRNQG